MKIVESDQNVTIPYDQGIRPYHVILAELVGKYTNAGHTRLFDMGCGVGNTLVELRKKNPSIDIVIADIDRKCLSFTRQKVQVQKEVFLQSPDDLYNLEEEFDIIILSHTLQYDPEPYRTMRKLLDMLRPGGYLMLASPNPSTPTKFLHNLIRRYYSEGIYTWDRSVLKNFIGSFEGARIVEITQDYLPLPLLNKYRFTQPCLVFLSRFFPWLSFSIIVVIEKDRTVQ